MKVAFLIPSTTKQRSWLTMEDTYLYKTFARSFLCWVSTDVEYGRNGRKAINVQWDWKYRLEGFEKMFALK